MRRLYAWRDRVLSWYCAGGDILRGMLKMGLVLLTLSALLGGHDDISGTSLAALILLVSLPASILPMGYGLLAVLALTVFDLAGYGLPAGAAGGGFLLAAGLFYLAFVPGRALWVLITMALSALSLPAPALILLGLTGERGSCFCGLIGLFIVKLVRFLFAQPMTYAGSDQLLPETMRLLREAVSQGMLAALVCGAGTYLTVRMIRGLTFVHSWLAASAAGCVVYGSLSLILSYLTGQRETAPFLLALNVLTALAAGAFAYLFGRLGDTSRTEYLQYEDEDYYYYVKAVPKHPAWKEQEGE